MYKDDAGGVWKVGTKITWWKGAIEEVVDNDGHRMENGGLGGGGTGTYTL